MEFTKNINKETQHTASIVADTTSAALMLIALANWPEHFNRVVLNSCDSYFAEFPKKSLFISMFSKEEKESSNRAPEIEHDYQKFVQSLDAEYIEEVEEQLYDYRKPVLIVWSTKYGILPAEDPHRLTRVFPNTTMELVEDSYEHGGFTEYKSQDLVESIDKFFK
jgi:pimeloyl-ACP methyl ester carboxylesterase